MPPAAAPPAAPPVPGCAHCGWKEQHRQECTWCDRRICEWHGERIASGRAGGMPRWQCRNDAQPMCWRLFNLRRGHQ